MGLLIVKPGVLDLIQDKGRYGFSKFGISPGGVMDIFAGSLANSLAGNGADKPLLEIHFPGPSLIFTEDTLMSSTGADFSATINEEPFPAWHPVVVRKNSLLQFHALKKGARAYLAVHGGFYVDKWLDSFSTNLKAAAGGWKGRKLEKGDELPLGFHDLSFNKLLPSEKDFRVLPWSPDYLNIYDPAHEIWFTEGREWPMLTEASKEMLSSESFVITNQSDRMGYQLNANSISLSRQAELISTPVNFGTIQLLPGGQLIILMADHQTTGGYPKVGHVISAHLPRLAQLKAGEEIRFKKVDLPAAEAALIHMQKELKNLHALCIDHFNQLICAR
jgi:antagonist of KipI